MLKGFLKLSLLLFAFVLGVNSQALAANWQQLKTKALELAIAGEDDDAHAAYQQAIDKAKEQFGESAPFVGELYFEMGEMDLAAKKFSWADDSLKQACHLMPNSQSAHLKLAELLLLEDRSADARAEAILVLQKHGNNLAARQTLAASYLGLGDKAKAVKEFYNYTLAASGGIVPAPVAKSAPAPTSNTEKPASSNAKQSKKVEKPVNESTLLPATGSGLLPATAPTKATKGKHGKHQAMQSGMPESSAKLSAKEKAVASKAKARAKAKAEDKARRAAEKAARQAAPKLVPLKAKPAQLKAKAKALPKGLVPPPPPMVPSFGGFVPPPPPAAVPVEGHAKPKEKVKETAKEPAKETAKESVKETAKETSKESGKAASKESVGKDHSTPAGEGADFLLDWAGSKKK